VAFGDQKTGGWFMAGGFELLEHTADIGIKAWGDSLEEAFEQAGSGLAEILGVWRVAHGTVRDIRANAGDQAALLVDFLNELVVLQESEGVGFAGIAVRQLSSTGLEALVETVPLDGEPKGIPVKGATYHKLRVDQRPDGGAEVQVYLDV
jgi:SHS2 domain-containing protein